MYKSYSVEQVAKKLQISRTAVYNRIKSEQFKDMVTQENGRTVISEELFTELQQIFKPKNEDDSTSLHMVDKVLQTLQEQLTMKDSQIQALQDHVVELTRLTENQQILLGNSQRQQEEVKMIDEPKKKSFWWWNR